MEIKRVVTLTFSPTGGTRKAADAVARGVNAPERLDLDRTSFESRWAGAELREGDFAVIGMPVYYGRVPALLTEFFRLIEARDIPAALVVTYGNQNLGDALLELSDESAAHGFRPVAGAAFIARHSFTDKLGTGRPNDSDLTLAVQFGQTAAQLVRSAADLSALSLTVPGSFPYRPAMDLPIAPATDRSKCTGCMLCQQQCPVQAINPLDPAEIDAWRCLDCARCIQNCPAGAKAIAVPALREKIAVMEAVAAAPKAPELFYAN
ncbi:MAG: 4Fe-4S binding protein [Oscillospiraceae bacterium]|jgi:ferredoxin